MTGPGAGTADLVVREAGSGPAVLFLHGLGGDHTVFNYQLGPLSERFHVLAPDLRGHGRSPTPNGSTFTMDELEGDLEALLARRGIGESYIVGMSAGGFLGLRFLLDHPERVRGFVGVGTAAQCDGHTRAVAGAWADVYRGEGYEAYVMRLLKDLFYPDWLEAHMNYIEESLRTMRERDLKSAVQWGLAVKNFDVRPLLGKVRTPTLAVHGMDDRVIDASHARFLRQAIPGAELKLLPFVGHMAPLEKPEEMTAVLLDFLSRAEGRRSAPP